MQSWRLRFWVSSDIGISRRIAEKFWHVSCVFSTARSLICRHVESCLCLLFLLFLSTQTLVSGSSNFCQYVRGKTLLRFGLGVMVFVLSFFFFCNLLTAKSKSGTAICHSREGEKNWSRNQCPKTYIWRISPPVLFLYLFTTNDILCSFFHYSILHIQYLMEDKNEGHCSQLAAHTQLLSSHSDSRQASD